MPAPYPGIYRAKAQRLDGNRLTANVPQIFGEQDVVITAFVGSPPTSQEMGWVAFHGGRPEFPVWLGVGTGGGGGGTGSSAGNGSSSGGGGTVTDVVWVGPNAPTGGIEMWWDTDDTVDLDPRYATPEYVDDRMPYVYTGTPVGGTTSGTTVSNANTLVIPAWHIPARILVTCFFRIEKTVAADAFVTAINNENSGVEAVQDWPNIRTTLQVTSTMSTVVNTTVNVALTLKTRVYRTSGSGTATFFVNSNLNRLDAVWTPA